MTVPCELCVETIAMAAKTAEALATVMRDLEARARCEHQRCTAVMDNPTGRTRVVFWCRDCGALGWPGEWRLPGAEP